MFILVQKCAYYFIKKYICLQNIHFLFQNEVLYVQYLVWQDPEHLSYNSHSTYSKIRFHNISVNIEARNANLLSLDFSRRDESNEPKFVKIRSLDGLKTGVCRITIFENTPKIRNSGRNLHINSTQTQM